MKKRCARKIWALVNPIEFAIQGASITPRQMLDQLQLRELSTIEAFARGAAGLQEWHDMAAVNNLTQTLASLHIGAEALPDCHKAEAALIEAAARYQATGRMGLSGPGLQALREVIGWHDAQRSSIARSRYERAIKLTHARTRSGHATVDLDKILSDQKETRQHV
jgi:hypothetical protein